MAMARPRGRERQRDDICEAEGALLDHLEQKWRLTRFNPGNAHVCGLSIHGVLVGSGELDGDQTKAEGHRVLPRFSPLSRVTTYVLLV
jgi:hypothetical protein